MKVVQKLLDFYVFSNIHVGIATACLVVISEANVEGASVSYSSYFVFFSTVFAYHFIRVFENCACHYKDVMTYLMKQSKEVLFVGFFSFIGTLFFGILIGVQDLLIVLPAALLTFWYAVPLFKLKGKRISLRNYPTLKILSIALVWAVITVLFPLQDVIYNSQVWLEFVQRFFLIMALVIPFDIRDVNHDATHLQTLPQKRGIAKAKIVGVGYLVVFIVLGFVKDPLYSTTLFVEILLFIVSLLLLVKAKENQSKYYASFWVESVPIIWFGLLWIMKSTI